MRSVLPRGKQDQASKGGPICFISHYANQKQLTQMGIIVNW